MSNQFISLLESISSTKHADLINSVLNGYILTESFFGNRKLPPSTDNKPSTYGKNIEDLSSKQQNAIKDLPSDEARSFEYDYKQLGKNCITICSDTIFSYFLIFCSTSYLLHLQLPKR